MSGFDNDVVYAKNADFTAADNQNVSENNGLITDGQLWIGSTATNVGGTHINVGNLISSDSSVTIAYDSPNIDLTVVGTPVNFTLTGNSGVATSSSSNVNVTTSNTTAIFTGSGDDLNFDYPSTNLGIGTSFPVLTSGSDNIVIGRRGSGDSITSGTGNTILGGASALILDTGTLNTFIGSGVGTNATVATSNIAIGSNSLALFVGTTAGVPDGNTCIGVSSLNPLLTGRFNAAFGYAAGQLYDSSESSNISIMNRGTVGESNTLRIGEQGSGDRQVNRCFIAGITGVTVSNTEVVTIDTTTGQLGSQPSVAPAGVNVAAYLATTLSAVTGDNVAFNPIFDSTNVNTGTAYNTTTGVFTTPSTGNYLYSIQLSYTGITALNVGSNIRARKNAVIIQNNAINIANIYDPIQTIATVMMTGVAVLTAGDTLDFTAAVGGNATPNANLFGDSVSSTLVITKLP